MASMFINDIKTQSRSSSVPERLKVRGLANKSKLIIRFIFQYQIGWLIVRKERNFFVNDQVIDLSTLNTRIQLVDPIFIILKSQRPSSILIFRG